MNNDHDYSDLSDKNREGAPNSTVKWDSVSQSVKYDPNSLHAAENSSASVDHASDQGKIEQNEAQWKNNVVGKSISSKSSGRKFSKKGVAIAAGASGGLITAAVGIFSFFTVSLAPIHVTEIITEKLNSSASTMEIRGRKILKNKFEFKGGGCKKGIMTTKCKFGTLTDRQIKELEAKGVKPQIDENADFLGRKRVTGYEIQVEDVDPKAPEGTKPKTKLLDAGNIESELKNNPKVRTALKKSWYDGRFFSFLDAAWGKLSSGLKLKKAPDAEGKTKEKIAEDIEKESNDTKNKTTAKADGADEEELETDDEETLNTKRANNQKKKGWNAVANYIDDAAAKLKKNKGVAKIHDFLTKVVSNAAVSSALGAFNILDSVCDSAATAFGAVAAVKKTRIDILIKFSLLFLSYSDMIKSGDATPEVAETIGNNLAGIPNFSENDKESEDEVPEINPNASSSSGSSSSNNSGSSNNSNNQPSSPSNPNPTSPTRPHGPSNQQSGIWKFITDFANTQNQEKIVSATDSQGYKAIAYNDVVQKPNDSAIQFVMGVIGPLAAIYNPIKELYTSTKTRDVCGFLGSPIGKMIGLTVSVVAFFLSFGASAVWSIVKGVGTQLLISTIISILVPIIAGKVVTAATTGEDYGNAISAGAGGLMAKNTIHGGGSGLTKTEAVAFYRRNETLIAEKSEEVRLALSPLDPTSRHTFVGSIIGSSLPYISQMRTISGIIPSLASMTFKSLGSILPSASAANEAGFVANMETCEDYDMKRLGVATDIFCNPYTGISTETLDMSTEGVIQKLIDNGDIDPEKEAGKDLESEEIKKYEKFCVNRQNVLGIADSLEDPEEEGDPCVYSDKHTMVPYYAAFFTDIRVQGGLDEGIKSPSGSKSSSSSPADSRAKVNSKGWAWPTTPDIPQINRFGEGGYSGGGYHSGVDFTPPDQARNTHPIFAVRDGVIKGAMDGGGGDNDGSNGGCGGTIYIDHGVVDGEQLYSQYCHVQRGSIEVKEGDRVRVGQKIGIMGTDGYSQGIHSHLSMATGWPMTNANRVDPMKYVAQDGVPPL